MENTDELTEWALKHLTMLRFFLESDDLERAKFYIAEVNVPSFNWKNRDVNYGEKGTDKIALHLLGLSLPEEILKTKRPLKTLKDGSCLFNSISLALTGTENYATFFRLLTAMYMISNSECEGLMTTADWRHNVESYEEELAYTLAQSGTGSAFTIEIAGCALDIAIESLFPNFGDDSPFANVRNTNNRIFNADQVNNQQITILWCSTYNIHDDLFAFNHFVPVVNCDHHFLSTRPTNLRTKASRPSSKTASATATRTTTNAAKGSVQNKDRVSSFCWPKNSNQDPNGMNINFLNNDNKKRG